jgi:hypothetical protein
VGEQSFWDEFQESRRGTANEDKLRGVSRWQVAKGRLRMISKRAPLAELRRIGIVHARHQARRTD